MKIAVATLGVALVLGGCGSPVVAEHAQQDVIDTCQASVRKMLKDPASATFDGWTAAPASGTPTGLVYDPTAGDLYYSASGMVNAKNGFGGYGGDEPYSCDAVVTANTVRAQAHSG